MKINSFIPNRKKQERGRCLLLVAMLFLGGTPFSSPLTAQSVEKRLNILEKELESLRLTRATKKYESVGGMGPAASEIYHASSGLSIGGYGEVKYSNSDSSHTRDSFDIHRFILYTGYRFNDWIVLNTEIEIEHANEIFVEFAYIDLQLASTVSLAIGLQLIPVGITNYKHEPTTFHSVNRPQSEKNIIPSTWRENGIMLHGGFFDERFRYRTGIVSGGEALNFSEESWIRGGRQKGSKAKSNDLAGVVQLNAVPLNNWDIGLSYYVGNNGQGDVLAYGKNDDQHKAPTDSDLLKQEKNRLLGAKVQSHLVEIHFIYEWAPLQFRGLFTRGWMSDADTRAVNRATGKNIGKQVEGGYLEFAYNILSGISNRQKLYVFIRNEYLNTQKKTITCKVGEDCKSPSYTVTNPHGDNFTGNRANGVIENKYDTKTVKGLANPANDRRVQTYGLAYLPHPNIVLKLDLENWNSQSNENEKSNPKNNKIDKINFGVAWIF